MARKIAFFEGWSWFKFNNLGLALGTNLKFCTSVPKGLKLKIGKSWRPNPTFVEVTGEKLVGRLFAHTHPDRVKPKYQNNAKPCYMDTYSFIIHIKTEDIYKDIANNVKKTFEIKL